MHLRHGGNKPFGHEQLAVIEFGRNLHRKAHLWPVGPSALGRDRTQEVAANGFAGFHRVESLVGVSCNSHRSLVLKVRAAEHGQMLWLVDLDGFPNIVVFPTN